MPKTTLPNRPSNTGFIYHVDKGLFTHIDTTIRKTFRLGNGEYQLTDVTPFIYQEDKKFLIKFIKNILQSKGKPFIDARLHIDGEERWFRFSPILITQDDGRSLLVNVAEVTDELHNLHSLQRFANKKNSILQILSHDLRGPLGTAKMVAQLAQRDSSKERIGEFLQTITRTIQQSIDLIADLTTREFLETIEVELVKKRVDIVQKIKEYVDELKNSAWLAKRNFHLISSHESLYMLVDEAKFMQIMNNLVTNALKFTRDGGNITIHIRENGDRVLFVFEDDGIGIPNALHGSIFKHYSSSGRIGLNGEPTTGDGLYIVKIIAEWHQGSVWFESSENEGARFYLEIPKL